jgi:hypothetical protein
MRTWTTRWNSARVNGKHEETPKIGDRNADYRHLVEQRRQEEERGKKKYGKRCER